MKALIQPVFWGLALVSMLALASGVALDVVVESTQASVMHDPAATAAGTGQQ